MILKPNLLNTDNIIETCLNNKNRKIILNNHIQYNIIEKILDINVNKEPVLVFCSVDKIEKISKKMKKNNVRCYFNSFVRYKISNYIVILDGSPDKIIRSIKKINKVNIMNKCVIDMTEHGIMNIYSAINCNSCKNNAYIIDIIFKKKGISNIKYAVMYKCSNNHISSKIGCLQYIKCSNCSCLIDPYKFKYDKRKDVLTSKCNNCKMINSVKCGTPIILKTDDIPSKDEIDKNYINNIVKIILKNKNIDGMEDFILKMIEYVLKLDTLVIIPSLMSIVNDLNMNLRQRMISVRLRRVIMKNCIKNNVFKNIDSVFIKKVVDDSMTRYSEVIKMYNGFYGVKMNQTLINDISNKMECLENEYYVRNFILKYFSMIYKTIIIQKIDKNDSFGKIILKMLSNMGSIKKGRKKGQWKIV